MLFDQLYEATCRDERTFSLLKVLAPATGQGSERLCPKLCAVFWDSRCLYVQRVSNNCDQRAMYSTKVHRHVVVR